MQLEENKVELGFCEPPVPQIIYIRNSENGKFLWYFWDADNQRPIPIYKKGICCYIKNIEIVSKNFHDEEVLKLRIQILADKSYAIQSGINSVFSRCFLLALSGMKHEQLRSPVTIAVRGNDPKTSKTGGATVFASIYDSNDQYCFYEWNGLVNTMDLATRCRSIILGETLSDNYQIIPVRKLNDYNDSKNEANPILDVEYDTVPENSVTQGYAKQTETVDWKELINQTTKELSRLGWSTEQGKQWLKKAYGKTSRQLLTPEQLIDFLKNLQQMPSQTEIVF
ncbi:MAG: hypothetical protein F6K50_07220 [Moorea sp. SIO3I7]|uniref:hypothetical protein n=1 Tax=Moorena sp. SIO3I8 TaxID=2607833 RepID=UPI0013C151AE|nr:hypothetical protein [Moorena sp. SIO3I8]NEN95327.1 hypothetical protein [Moorena sp. SIO3I7]NEO07389.1 hypothetical protein [Moorena sp. SIO3I8]